MNKRGSYGSMADRVAAGRPAAAPRSPAAVPSAAPEPAAVASAPPVRHCWVSDRHGRLPGLLLEWRQRPDGWHGRVVHLVEDAQGWVLVEEWLPAAMLGAG
jgi:hypothetical protein